MISEKKEAVGYWRTDEPPMDGTQILGVWGKEIWLVTWEPDGCTWNGEEFMSYKQPDAWSLITPPGVTVQPYKFSESIHRRVAINACLIDLQDRVEVLEKLEKRIEKVNESDWNNRGRIVFETANRVDDLEERLVKVEDLLQI